MDAFTELAKMLKERENKPTLSMTTGKVLKPPPEVEIRLNDVIILKKEHLIFSSHMLKEYKRELHLVFDDTVNGQTKVKDAHFHELEKLSVDTKKAEITTLDTIEEGDEVILMPTTDYQFYFVLDKAVRFK